MTPNYNLNNPPPLMSTTTTAIVPTNTPPIKWNVVPQLQPTQPILRPSIKPSNSSNRNGIGIVDANGSGNGGGNGGTKKTFDWGDLDPLS